MQQRVEARPRKLMPLTSDVGKVSTMSVSPDFYSAVNAIFKYLHDVHGKAQLVDFWRSLGREYYRDRWQRWRDAGPQAIAEDWQKYFLNEPQAEVAVKATEDQAELDIRVCPAIKHLRDHLHEIVPYFCEHCDHICGAMAKSGGYEFERTGGMGACHQRFVRIRLNTDTD